MVNINIKKTFFFSTKLIRNKMVIAKKFIYAKRFDGLPKVTDFRLEDETLPELNDGG